MNDTAQLIGYNRLHWLPEYHEHTNVRANNCLSIIDKFNLSTMVDYGQNEYIYVNFINADSKFSLIVIEREEKPQSLNTYKMVTGEYASTVMGLLQPNTLYTYHIHGYVSAFFSDPIKRLPIFEDMVKSGTHNSYVMLSALTRNDKQQHFKLFSLETGEEVSYDWKYYDK
jgi:hypothetical protein